jgi:hypothetical protein
MRAYAPLAALLLVACGAPMGSGDPSDAATADRPAGWAPSGQEVLGPAECMPGLLACQRGASPGRPAAPDAQWFCIAPDNTGHCGVCGRQCLNGPCLRSDAGTYACAP